MRTVDLKKLIKELESRGAFKQVPDGTDIYPGMNTYESAESVTSQSQIELQFRSTFLGLKVYFSSVVFHDWLPNYLDKALQKPPNDDLEFLLWDNISKALATDNNPETPNQKTQAHPPLTSTKPDPASKIIFNKVAQTHPHLIIASTLLQSAFINFLEQIGTEAKMSGLTHAQKKIVHKATRDLQNNTKAAEFIEIATTWIALAYHDRVLEQTNTPDYSQPIIKEDVYLGLTRLKEGGFITHDKHFAGSITKCPFPHAAKKILPIDEAATALCKKTAGDDFPLWLAMAPALFEIITQLSKPTAQTAFQKFLDDPFNSPFIAGRVYALGRPKPKWIGPGIFDFEEP